jgi:large subunit ribosomal protein L3
MTVERIRASGEGSNKKYEAYTEDLTLKVGQVLTLMDIFKDVPAVRESTCLDDPSGP